MSTARVDFTRGAAERIARVVRLVEQGDRNQSGPTWDKVGGGTPYRLSVATFTGSWATGTWKTVTLTGSTSTASVYNWCNPAECGGVVVFGKASGTNSVVEITMAGVAGSCAMTIGSFDLTQVPGYDSSVIQFLGHNADGPCLQWYSIAPCSTATAT